MADTDAQALHIYEEWHAGFNEQNMDRVLALYAEDAVIETPAVFSVYPDRNEGILRWRDEIRKLFDRNLANLRPASLGACFLRDFHERLEPAPAPVDPDG